MLRLTVETNNLFNANVIASFLRNVKTVNKVIIEKPDSRKQMTRETTTQYNWTKPSRPATDEEIEQMLDECEKEIENGFGIPSNIAKEQTMKEIKKWRKKKA